MRSIYRCASNYTNQKIIMLKNLFVLFITSALSLLVGCASTSSPSADPLEGMNRATFKFNDAVDKAVLTPVAKGYQAVTPSFVRAGVTNAFSNIGDVSNSVNNLLQGKPTNAISDLGRLLVNSTLGILGLFDVATPMGLQKNNEDFGQTLGKWGVGSGPYLVLPLLGPSTLRDAVGRVPDSQLGYSSQIQHVPTRNVTLGLDIINIRAELLNTSRTLDEASLDKYQFLRDAFLQRRLNQVHDGKVPQAERDKLEESLEAPATPAPTAAKPADKK
jgi:phospholipid-binding lipoprotein MlaA